MNDWRKALSHAAEETYSQRWLILGLTTVVSLVVAVGKGL